jgi:hypothetical protein
VLLLLLPAAIGMSGCIVLPTDRSEPVPDLAPHIPPKVLGSSEPVLVLAQNRLRKRQAMWGSMRQYLTWDTSTRVTARILPGKEVPAMKDSIVRSSSSGLLFAACFSNYCGTDTQEASRDELQHLCLVTREGTEVRLSPEPGGWKVSGPSRIHAARRDAMVAAFGANPSQSFANVDGPCGIWGDIAWPPEMLSRIVTMIAALPDQPPRELRSPFDAIAGAAHAGVAGDGGTMILSEARWRGTALPNPPMFLDSATFDDIARLVALTERADLLTFFPEVTAAHLSGSRAVDNHDIGVFCVIGSGGRVLQFSPSSGDWKALSPTPPYVEWKRRTTAAIEGRGVPGVSDGDCVPAGAAGWAPSHRSRAIAFVAALPSQPAPHPASDIVSGYLRPSASAGANEANGIVAVETRAPDGSVHVVPFFIPSPRESAPLLAILLTIDPDELLAALPGTLALAATHRARSACVIDRDGARSILRRTAAGEGWDPPLRSPPAAGAFAVPIDMANLSRRCAE